MRISYVVTALPPPTPLSDSSNSCCLYQSSQVTQMEGIGAVRGREQIHPGYLLISIIVGSPALVISGQVRLSRAEPGLILKSFITYFHTNRTNLGRVVPSSGQTLPWNSNIRYTWKEFTKYQPNIMIYLRPW